METYFRFYSQTDVLKDLHIFLKTILFETLTSLYLFFIATIAGTKLFSCHVFQGQGNLLKELAWSQVLLNCCFSLSKMGDFFFSSLYIFIIFYVSFVDRCHLFPHRSLPCKVIPRPSFRVEQTKSYCVGVHSLKRYVHLIEKVFL